MTETKFKIGDVVMLKSGGPEMTISEIYNNDTWCTCTWFTDGKRYNDSFDTRTIDPVGDDTF